MKRYQRCRKILSILAQKKQGRFTSASPLERFHSSAIWLQDVATSPKKLSRPQCGPSPKKLSRPHAAPVHRIRVPILGVSLRRGRIHVLRRDQTVVSTHHEAKLWVDNHTTILAAQGHHEDHASDRGRYRTHDVSEEGLFLTHFDATLTFHVVAIEEDVQKFLTRDTVGHELQCHIRDVTHGSAKQGSEAALCMVLCPAVAPGNPVLNSPGVKAPQGW